MIVGHDGVQLLIDIAADPAADLSIPATAARLSVSIRHVTRLFLRELGVTPGRYVERVRVEAARMQLESNCDGVEAIAGRCGFGNGDSMRAAPSSASSTSPPAPIATGSPAPPTPEWSTTCAPPSSCTTR